MHILEQYALNSGVKIKQPFIYEKFFPLTFDKYISFHPATKPSKTYDLWQEVINLIFPYLEKNNIKIIQIGEKEDKSYSGAMNLLGLTNINQTAYILKNALLHVGADSFPTHVASYYDKKIVSLYSNNYISCVKPYFGNPQNQILLEPTRTTKPCFSFHETPKTINKIKPEIIAKNILKLLDIENSINIDSIYFGMEYNQPKLELVPNMNIDPRQYNSTNIIVRMDLEFNEQILRNQLKICDCVIFTDKSIDKQLLIDNKSRIAKIIYEIKENNDIDFANFLQFNSIPYQLFTYLKGDSIEKIKLDYIDQEQIIEINADLKTKIKTENIYNLFYRSNKKILSNGKIFLSVSSYKKDISAAQNTEAVIDCPEFWKELENFYIFRVDKN
jgi:hypothetical protein